MKFLKDRNESYGCSDIRIFRPDASGELQLVAVTPRIESGMPKPTKFTINAKQARKVVQGA